MGARAKTELLSKVSHEMRAALNIVLGTTELLADTELDSKQRAHVAALQRAGQRLLALANEMLDVARKEAGAPHDAAHTPVVKAPRAQAASASRVLLVDDSEESRALIEEFLRTTGVTIEHATDGKTALDMLARESFDLVLMDLHLPGMDGIATTAAIRRAEKERGAREVPVIALSGDALGETVKRALGAGCVAHLAKPITKAALLDAIARWVAPASRVPPQARALMPKFLANRARDVDRIREAVARSDFETIATLGHNMHGNGKSYGLPTISAIGKRLEAAAKARNAGRVRATVDELEAFLANGAREDGDRSANAQRGR